MRKIKARGDFKDVRIKQGHTAVSLSKSCGLKLNTLYKIESGNCLSPNMAKKITDNMGLTFDDLFEIVEG